MTEFFRRYVNFRYKAFFKLAKTIIIRRTAVLLFIFILIIFDPKFRINDIFYKSVKVNEEILSDDIEINETEFNTVIKLNTLLIIVKKTTHLIILIIIGNVKNKTKVKISENVNYKI